jgi:hypothetical protein
MGEFLGLSAARIGVLLHPASLAPSAMEFTLAEGLFGPRPAKLGAAPVALIVAVMGTAFVWRRLVHPDEVVFWMT